MEEKTTTRVREKVKMRGKSFFAKVFFSRNIIFLTMVCAQIWFLIAALLYLSSYSVYIMAGSYVMSFACIVYMVNCKIKPEFKLVWILLMSVVPIVGVAIYIFVLVNPGSAGLKKGIRRVKAESRGYLATKPETREALLQEDVNIRQMSHFLECNDNYPTYHNTVTKYYPSGESKWEDLLIELKKAEKFIFLEYFIIESGAMWDSVLDVLLQKVDEGVEVRVLYDGSNMVQHLPYNYRSKLEKMGIKAVVYAPIIPLLSTKQNNRDHRKIVVIDGKVGFTGGINLSDEYVNRKTLFGRWKDVGIKVTGDAVDTLTVLFLQIWNEERKTSEDYSVYLNKVTEPVEGEKGYVIPYGDDATNGKDIAEYVYLDIINKAKRYVHIMTPYLVIDNDMRDALIFAAQRGVDVSLIIPHIPDKKMAWYIARTEYPVLVAAGIHIYEYTPGFIHAKMFVADGECGVVGTINLDYRSLYHHFECAVYVYHDPIIDELEKDFQDTIAVSQHVEPGDYKKIPAHQRALGRVMKIWSPLL